ncbi:MAG: LysM peptidoglycan-binding domain-containing protein [Gammaproteobacteria bacterium]|nr:LysM peptidoglycan-binding domain-containing protein [Gammaproteobacteria bacterium]NNF49394.1 LysM peptidoglycan-binding domain-containing protein [Woeseiaceae bacterium]MBT8093533.1 LysM peptidoglycan-binding domain-containing protein [Gammaproteobacteria bacterium]MBT8106503.1 LysM peptidoglycan-binding domain-containing protein [Gammaproteobacteria bacterium]NNK26518.1 LysM peptidoglycan-binding domain-containing protein [Woeseiaceae bacterium]
MRLCLAFFVVLGAGTVSASDVFPQPPELRPDVDFWVSIFTEYSTEEGVLHDNRKLGVVYARVAVPAALSRRERNRRIAKRRKELQSVLRTLAAGKRDNLSDEEARVLALWPAGVTNKTLSTAVGRIRFQLGLKDRFRRGLERSGRWRDYVNDQFTALGVPVELAALPHVESSYNPAARSHVGASGIWQFTRSTGRRYMRVDHVVDERNDPFAATRAAGRLLAYNYSITGNWPMAITAYNHGLSGVRRAMRRHGDDALVDILRNYNGRTFGFASRNFYVAFLAAMEVDQNPDKYFPGVMPDDPTEYAAVKLTSYVSADGLSEATGVSERQIARHNPGLQATVWEGSKHLPKGYELRLPVAATSSPLATLIARLPDDAAFDKQLPDLFHTVSRGDTLSQIAAAYDTRVSTLVALNQLSSSHRIRAGQRLRLPAAGPLPAAPEPASPEPVVVAATAPAVEEPAPVAVEVTSLLPGTVRTALLSDPSDYTVADDGTIEVQPLETLGHYGDWLEIKTQRLRDLNGLAFRTPVELGQRIRLDLGTVDAKSFEEQRVAYHRAQQDRFFRRHVISDVIEHTIRRGESIWIVALRRYEVPMWLFRQYNPGLDMHNVRPGMRVQIPVLADASSG